MIHFIHLSSAPGGIEVLIPEIISRLPERACRSYVVRPHRPGKANVYEGTGISVTYGHQKNLKAAWKLWAYARQHRQDVFHVFNLGPFFTLLLRLAGVKRLIYAIHGTIYWKTAKQKFTRKPFWKLALRSSYEVMANSRYSRDRFADAIGYQQDITVVYNPINSERFELTAKERREHQIRIIYCGRLTPGKNLMLWLDLAAEIHRHHPDASFYLYGTGPLQESLQQYAKTLGLDSRVHFMGHTQDIAAAYQSAGLLLFLSEYESFGNVVVESILCGTPVIASGIPSMKEIFENYPEFIVELDEHLKDNVLSKINDISKLRVLALEARKEFIGRFSVEQHIAALEKLYEQFD